MSNPQPAADPRPDVPLRVRVSGDSGLPVIGWGAAVDSDECMTVLDPAAGNARMRVFLETPGNITYRAVYAE